MRSFFRNLTLTFGAGCLGGLANSLLLWFLGSRGITASLSIKIAPILTLPWLYPRIVWGGIWGVLLIFPISRNYILRGLIYSLAPTAFQLFVIFPMREEQGIMGLELGNLTPLLVLFLNGVWGLAAGIWMIMVYQKSSGKKRTPKRQEEPA